MKILDGPFTAFDGKTLEQTIRELCDREEIRELISRYAQRVAQGVSVADMYTDADDGAFIVRYPDRPPTISRGREALNKTYADVRHGTQHPMPMIHNHLLLINGDEATGQCSNELRWQEDGRSMVGSGFYQDRFRREGGRWKFVVRDMTFMHWVPLSQGWGEKEIPAPK
jgi:hypothetical protein